MSNRKDKHEPENFVELDTEEYGFVLKPTQIEVGLGYSISVRHDENGKLIVDVKTYGEVDYAKIRKEINRVFPNAQIKQLNQTRSVTIVKRRRRKHLAKKK